MTTNARRAEALERFIRGALDGDDDVLGPLVTDDVRAWTPTAHADNREQLLELAARRDAAFSDPVITVVPLDVGGDFACAEWIADLTHTGALGGEGGADVPPNEVRVRVHGITVAEFEGDLICSVREYWDVLELLGQLEIQEPA